MYFPMNLSAHDLNATLISSVALRFSTVNATLLISRFFSNFKFQKSNSNYVAEHKHCLHLKLHHLLLVKKLAMQRYYTLLAFGHSCPIFHCITRFVLTTRDAISNANSFCSLQYPTVRNICSGSQLTVTKTNVAKIK